MNVKFLNPFVEAAYEVLTSEMACEVQRGDLRLENGNYQTDDVTVVIALVGAVEGMAFYSMSNQTARQFSAKMLGEAFDGLNGLAQSGVAELGNVITGRASMKLAAAGYEATISPPSLILGKGAGISTLDTPRLIVPLKTAFGPVVIHLALRQGAVKNQTTAQIPVPDAPRV